MADGRRGHLRKHESRDQIYWEHESRDQRTFEIG